MTSLAVLIGGYFATHFCVALGYLWHPMGGGTELWWSSQRDNLHYITAGPNHQLDPVHIINEFHMYLYQYLILQLVNIPQYTHIFPTYRHIIQSTYVIYYCEGLVP